LKFLFLMLGILLVLIACITAAPIQPNIGIGANPASQLPVLAQTDEDNYEEAASTPPRLNRAVGNAFRTTNGEEPARLFSDGSNSVDPSSVLDMSEFAPRLDLIED
jgi:hypothetical protein